MHGDRYVVHLSEVAAVAESLHVRPATCRARAEGDAHHKQVACARAPSVGLRDAYSARAVRERRLIYRCESVAAVEKACELAELRQSQCGMDVRHAEIKA